MSIKITQSCFLYLKKHDYDFFIYFILNAKRTNKELSNNQYEIWKAEYKDNITHITVSDFSGKFIKEYKLSHHFPPCEIEVHVSNNTMHLKGEFTE